MTTSLILFLVALYMMIMFIVGVASTVAIAVVSGTRRNFPYVFFITSFAFALAGILFL